MGKCPFCENKTSPTYRNSDILGRYVSERGKIFDRAKSSACSYHQRKLALAIKRARFLALLPFIVRPR